jgi:hypothetical protein
MREAVTTMATTFLGWRPSTPASACPPNALAAAQVPCLGQPAVAIRVQTAPIFGHKAVAGAMKINNYMGTIGAAAATEGATASSLIPMNSVFVRVQTVQGDKVKGGDARGIPPRGKPV